MLPEYPMPTSSLVIAPRLRPLAERPRLLRRCGLFARGRGERGRADSRRDVNIETARSGPERPQTEHRIEAWNTTRAESSPYGQPAKSSICLIVHAIDR